LRITDDGIMMMPDETQMIMIQAEAALVIRVSVAGQPPLFAAEGSSGLGIGESESRCGPPP
jgi:hypothetical protein